MAIYSENGILFRFFRLLLEFSSFPRKHKNCFALTMGPIHIVWNVILWPKIIARDRNGMSKHLKWRRHRAKISKRLTTNIVENIKVNKSIFFVLYPSWKMEDNRIVYDLVEGFYKNCPGASGWINCPSSKIKSHTVHSQKVYVPNQWTKWKQLVMASNIFAHKLPNKNDEHKNPSIKRLS